MKFIYEKLKLISIGLVKKTTLTIIKQDHHKYFTKNLRIFFRK